ncbi:hypothetical protein [Shimia sp. FJ5]|uniref:hypothetical protein n=1 Tax=Shimia sp. FJ5 TaxID=3079054 RepID=UPI00293DB2DF|nr:hypothetical protein [Shimia sp. FJ5]MDV4145212.1 hypothetical protein [Shimia sp. FJ5]
MRRVTFSTSTGVVQSVFQSPDHTTKINAALAPSSSDPSILEPSGNTQHLPDADPAGFGFGHVITAVWINETYVGHFDHDRRKAYFNLTGLDLPPTDRTHTLLRHALHIILVVFAITAIGLLFSSQVLLGILFLFFYCAWGCGALLLEARRTHRLHARVLRLCMAEGHRLAPERYAAQAPLDKTTPSKQAQRPAAVSQEHALLSVRAS